MADITKDLKIIFSAEDRASGKADQLNKSLGRLRSQGASLVKTGAAITAVGAGIGFAFVKAAKAAISFEDAFAGVRKTVDATEEEFQQLTDGFKRLSKETPIAFEEMAKIGEIAGVLGIQGVANILKFSETISLIGPTTNLTTEVAATAFARLFTIMAVNINEVDRLGSALVGLGNNFATTEAEITEMALRLSGAGRIIGLSVSDVLGLGAALTAVGVKAQAGGTALSRAFASMAGAIAAGGEELDLFAEVARVSSVDFAKSFRDKPIEAIITFIKGLKLITEEGGNVFAALDRVGFISIRQKDAFLRLAGAGDLLTNAVALASEEWEKNTALVEEAQKRFKTVASQIKIVQNNFGILAAGIGEQLLPAIRAIAGFLTKLAQRFDGVSEKTKKFITFGGVAVSLFLVLTGTIVALTGVVLLFAAASITAGLAIFPIIAIIALVIIILGALGVTIFLLIKKWSDLKELTVIIWKNILRFLVGIFNSIKNFASNIFRSIRDEIILIFTGLRDFWVAIWTEIRDFFVSIIRAIITFLTPALNVIKSTWETVWGGIRNFFFGVFDAIASKVETVVNFIARKIEQAKRLVETVRNLATAPIRGLVTGVRNIIEQGRAAVGLQAGGIVTRPTMALIGEAGPEAVIPLNRLGGLGANIVINISGPVFSDDADRLGAEVGDAILKRLGLNIRIG